MNYNRDKDIILKMLPHYEDAQKNFSEKNIVGLFLQGSQNYNLDLPESDVDTKLIVTPTLNEIVLNNSPVSTTYVRENNEHIDFKDIRLYIDTFKKQNINFIEILFTKYFIVPDNYYDEWNMLINKNEEIARLNPYRAVKAMKGMALEKFYALDHPYPSKLSILEKYGYDPKQLHHLLRVEEFINRYIDGEKYKDCLIPNAFEYLLAVKKGWYSKTEAIKVAKESLQRIEEKVEHYCAIVPNENDKETENLLEEVKYKIIKKSLVMELNS